jgi:S1-C subfamily serine protease
MPSLGSFRAAVAVAAFTLIWVATSGRASGQVAPTAPTAVSPPAPPRRELTDVVYIVEAQFHAQTRRLFSSLADEVGRQSGPVSQALAAQYRGLADKGAAGTGWLYRVDDHTKYVITNAHVVRQAEVVTLRRILANGGQQIISGCSILFVDDLHDLAVIDVPPSANLPDAGLELGGDVSNGDDVFTSGFPGLFGEQSYRYDKGIVNQARLQSSVFSRYDHIIQHNAQINHGSSGGPLLVAAVSDRKPTDFSEYKVVGVNVAKAASEDNVNFAIPIKYVQDVIGLANQVKATSGDGNTFMATLELRGQDLARELRSAQPDYEKIRRFVSYLLVSQVGLEAFATSMQQLAPDKRTLLMTEFLIDPVETLRTSVVLLFWQMLALNGDLSSLDYKEITDKSEARQAKQARTNYTVKEKIHTISWTFEHGNWRISNLSVRFDVQGWLAALDRPPPPQPQSNATPPTPSAVPHDEPFVPPARGTGFIFHLATGTGSADGTFFTPSVAKRSASAATYGIEIDFPYNELVGIIIGANYIREGLAFTSTTGNTTMNIDSALGYVQAPFLLRLDYSRHARPITLRLVGKGGVAGELLVSKSGNDLGRGVLLADTNFYDGHKSYNLSMLVGGGFELGFGKNRDLFVGAEVRYVRHLFDDWSERRWPNQMNFRYQDLLWGGYVKFE